MKMDYAGMGKRIRAIRVNKKITQEELAEMIDVGTTHISHIETGNTIPSIKIFVSIANALSVSTDELLCDSVIKSDIVFKSEIAKIIEDCEDNEIKIICDTIKALKTSLRERKD